MSEFTLWAVWYRSDDGEGVAGKYIDEDPAEHSRQALEAQGFAAWVEEERWAFGQDGPFQIDSGAAEFDPSWSALVGSLTETLAGLQPGQFLSLTASSGPWVQFIAVEGGLRAEAVGSEYLPDAAPLTLAQEQALRSLGWRPPIDDDGIERAQNWYREYSPVLFAEVAALAVRTLASVYAIPYPQNLHYFAADQNDGSELLFPDLGIAVYEPNDEAVGALTDDPIADVRDLLLEALEELSPDIPGWDDDVLAIRYGCVRITMRVVNDPPLIQISAPVLTKVPESVHLLRELNDVNNRVDFVRLSLTSDGTLLAAAELYGLPFVKTHALAVIGQIGEVANSLLGRLQGRYGGDRIIGTSPAAREQ